MPEAKPEVKPIEGQPMYQNGGLLNAIRALFGSRKFVLLLVGTISAVGLRLGLQLDPEIVALIVGLFAVAIGSIAHEDGKAKSAPTMPALPDFPDVKVESAGPSTTTVGPVPKTEPAWGKDVPLPESIGGGT